MNEILKLTGQNAVVVARSTNRQPEILVGDQWKAASSVAEAMRVYRHDPQLVRLQCSARVLIEDILKRGISDDQHLIDLIDAALAAGNQPSAEALAIIKQELLS